MNDSDDDAVVRAFFETDEEYERTAALWPLCPECGARRTARCPICSTVGDLFPLADAEFWDGTEPVVLPPEPAKPGCGCAATIERACKPDCSEPVEGEYNPHPPSPPPVDSDNQLFWGFPDLRKDPLPRLHDMASITVTSAQAAPDRTLDLEPLEQSGALDGRSAFDESGNPRLVVCATCDEPFIPKFAPLCRCGYRFDDGPDDADETSLDPETIARYRVQAGGDEPLNGRVIGALIALAAACAFGALYSWWLFR